ncbi:unnamed protein product [Alternaria alternata]|uniref:uncharacterized protein n=1 Tax=Alternaria postmessia TaxID=1187938 RepID=UPI0022250075|nr:uncharacterized protein J4E82_009540 [Alternaria postmessia]KAI5371800.1 hypothetical protein J4E82_009540 [Alternaria postmessia]
MAPPTRSVIPETVKQNEAGRQVNDDLEDSSDRVLSGRITKPAKTAKRIRGRATGYDMKSPEKKPTDQADNTSLWANEAGWLRPYLDLVPADQSITIEVSGLLCAAKLVYIIQHEITLKDIFSLLKGVSNQVTQSGEHM